MGPQHLRNGMLHVRQQKTRIDSGSHNACCRIAETTNPSSDFLDYSGSVTASYFGQWFDFVAQATRPAPRKRNAAGAVRFWPGRARLATGLAE
jgi:hypothetical protein